MSQSGFWKPTRAQAWAWSKDLFRALTFLHQSKPPLLHRDIKPANLLLTGDFMTLKVGDFGLCKALRFGNRQMTGNTGTKRYMAPEVHRNDPTYSVILNTFPPTSPCIPPYPYEPQSPCCLVWSFYLYYRAPIALLHFIFSLIFHTHTRTQIHTFFYRFHPLHSSLTLHPYKNYSSTHPTTTPISLPPPSTFPPSSFWPSPPHNRSKPTSTAGA